MMRILITGGTGALGSALVRKLVPEVDHEYDRIVVYARGEHRHVEMAKEHGVNVRGDGSALRFFVGDVRDPERLKRAMEGVDMVIHAAALKHVHVGEYNPQEFVATNVMGTANVVNAAIEAGVDRMIMVSTDKACSPVNLYGATKLTAEKITLAGNALSGGRTKFAVCRYGNVSGSTGSVIPLWTSLLREKKSLPVTDAEMTRFWMTIDEAVDFVLYALENANGGEVFVPRLPTYRVGVLATAVSVAHQPHLQPLYHEVGMRDGEKMHESMISEDEAPWTHVSDSLSHYVIVPGCREPLKGYTFVPEDFSLRSDDLDLEMGVQELVEKVAAGSW